MKSTIRSLLGFLILVPATLSVTMAAAQAQKKPPQIGYVFPAGGRQGDSVHVTFGGQYFAGKPSAIISGTHIKATLVEQPKGKELEYCIIAVNKAGEGEASNTAMVVL